MVENALRWPMMGGTYSEIMGCVGAALVDLLCREMDFNSVDGFWNGFGDCLTLVLVNVKGFGEEGALREPMNSNRSFPVMSTRSIVLAALKRFRHMPDFRPVFGLFV